MSRFPAPITMMAVAILIACNAEREAERDAPDADRPYSFTLLEYPGATFTVASDIADDGRVVGWYATGDIHKGFVYSGGDYTTIEYPGAVLTHVAGIASDGTLVGAYRKAGEPQLAYHGFLRRPSGDFVEVAHPDHPHGMAQRILENGTIVGCYHSHDLSTSMRGIAISGGAITVQDIPGSMLMGGTPDGRRLLGSIYGASRSGFIVEGDRVTHLEAPGSTATEAWDMNASGAIVGAMVDSAGTSRGFVLEDGQWVPILVPGAQSTVAFGINDRGEIVGGFQDAEGRRRGYIAARQ